MTMDRKAFLGGSLRLAAGVGVAWPCLGWAADAPQSPHPAGPAAPCGKLAGDYPLLESVRSGGKGCRFRVSV